MTLLIDSAQVSEVSECAIKYPWIGGLSSNPKLLAEASIGTNPLQILKQIEKIIQKGSIFYQVTSQSEEKLLRECEIVAEIFGERLVVKIMPSYPNLEFISKHNHQFKFCLTAVHNLTQAKLAHQAGACSIAVYVNRMLKNNLKPYELMENVCVLFPHGKLKILAASIKNIQEFEFTLLTGAQYLTLPYFLFAELVNHPLTDFAFKDFTESGIGVV